MLFDLFGVRWGLLLMALPANGWVSPFYHRRTLLRSRTRATSLVGIESCKKSGGQRIVSRKSNDDDDQRSPFSLSKIADGITTDTMKQSGDATWRWCLHFVVEYGLCPWARASVETKHAVQIFLVDFCKRETRQDVLEYLAQRFSNSHADPQTSIYFVVFLDDESQQFSLFYDWFVKYEEHGWEMDEQVTLAPFHPDWTYSSDGNSVLDFEKQSPYPTISLVATEAIDRAGETATRRIAEANEEILNGKSVADWKGIFNRVVFQPDETNAR